MTLTLRDVASLTGGELRGDPEAVVRRVAPLESAGPEDLTLVVSSRYLPYLQATRGAAVLVADSLGDAIPDGIGSIRVRDPHAALARLLPLLHPPEEQPPGIHPTAAVAADAELGEEVSVGPYAVVAGGAWIGPRTRLASHVSVGAGCRIGADCILHPHVTVDGGAQIGDRCILHSGARLGGDGFGFAFEDGAHCKIPQVGGCRIEDDVEIGANSTIDRGSIGDTVVGQGTKIDNLVHLGHNVRVGRHVIIVAQTGISGSCVIEDGAVLGGQVGIGGHITVGAHARVGAQAGVIGDIAAGETVSGYPARPHGEAMRAYAALFRLPELVRRMRRIEQALFGRSGPAEERDGDVEERGSESR